METRRRRHSTSATAKRYLDLEFGGHPSPKRRKTEPVPVESETLTTKSFYGKREKKSFPHSPGRRKAAHKILNKLSDENTDSDQENKATKCHFAPISKRSSFDFHSTSTSDSTDTESRGKRKSPLHGKSSQKKNGRAKKTPLGIINTVKTPRHNRLPELTSKSTGKLPRKTALESEKDEQKTPIISGKKFFKTRSPGSLSVGTGGVVVRRGFDLKFVARKLKVSGTPSKVKENKKCCIKTKTVPVNKINSVNADKFHNGTSFHSDDRVTDVAQSVGDPFKTTEKEYIATPIGTFDATRDSAIDSAYSSDLHSSSQVVNERNDNTNIQGSELQASNNAAELDSLADGSVDLFSIETASGRNTPNNDSAVTNSPTSSVVCRGSGNESDVSLLSEMSAGCTGSQGEKRLFPIFMNKESPLSASQSRSLRTSASNSPSLSPLLRSTRSKDKLEQMTIDAGQKRYGVTQCDSCGMIYNIADPDDETTHFNYHRNLMAALKFPGWKKENVVQEYPLLGSRIIKVTCESPKYALKKLEEVAYIMNEELGSPDQTFNFRPTYQAFLYVSDEKRLEGCCIAEPLTEGYPVMPDSDSQSSLNHPGNRPWYCSDKPVPAKVGISRIWVHNQARRKGIATKLLDCVRQWFSYGTVISKRRIAFSDPTNNGKTLAMKYTESPKFLVYKFTK